ncbi:MAG: hypothetical protein VYA49_02490 [Planctomycetota bacterium]|jgi:hypothetical protein|nr:hypothetical protein [Planctomycetaceae bacterium]MCK4615281.1 hypothetical protein [Pirellulales bacterium]MEE2796227.1 hypothetical protein [Planctomycetota bacterium]
MDHTMLAREEYIEQSYLFRTLGERMLDGVATQEALKSLGQEILATTKLPLAIDYLVSDLKLTGTIAPAMRQLNHYFTAFQTFVMSEAEDEEGRFDLRTALLILEREAQYLAETGTPEGLFFYRFECLSRNRLDYMRGLSATAADDIFNDDWKNWITMVSRQVGLIDLADLIYVRSAELLRRQQRQLSFREDVDLHSNENTTTQQTAILFGEKEGRIAWANRGKDPLYLFAALQRQLGYPVVPKPKRQQPQSESPALMARRIDRLELRVKLLEEETKDGIDLSQFDPKNDLFKESPKD